MTCENQVFQLDFPKNSDGHFDSPRYEEKNRFVITKFVKNITASPYI